MKLAEWLNHPLVERAKNSFLGRIVLALLEIRLYERALTLAGQAFIALVPLLIVLATLVSSSDSEAVGQWLIDRFDLTGASAEAVRSLFGRPPSASGSLTIIGMVTLLVSASSFARAVQRTYEVAWNLPAQAHKRVLHGIGGVLVLLALLPLLGLLGGIVNSIGGRVLALIVQFCLAVPAWWLLSRLLLSARVAWHLLLPGAVASAVGHVLISWGGSIYVPLLIERNTHRYGVIGVAIALISWLVVMAFLIVAAAVIGAQLGVALAAHEATQREDAPEGGPQ